MPWISNYFAVRIDWDVHTYYLKVVQRGCDKQRRKFPNPLFGTFSDPLTVVDSKGRIVLWYLPGLLSEEVEVSFLFLFLFFPIDFPYKIGWCFPGNDWRPTVT
jgi:hypothetical protein